MSWCSAGGTSVSQQEGTAPRRGASTQACPRRRLESHSGTGRGGDARQAWRDLGRCAEMQSGTPEAPGPRLCAREAWREGEPVQLGCGRWVPAAGRGLRDRVRPSGALL